MEPSAYLDRICFDDSVRPDFAGLRAIHRAHQYVVPFENIDVLLRDPAVLGLEANYDKIADVPEAAGLWPSMRARHEVLFARTSEKVT